MIFPYLQKKIKVPLILQQFNKVFEKHNFSAFLVGGAVRDIFLKKTASDFDVATNATPQDVMKMFNTVIPTGIEHGTVTVHFNDLQIEVTTFRTESGYSDGRHPDSINYAATIEEDLSRRDFTMNAIAVNLSNGKIVDPFNGKKDIKNKIIRTVGNPFERFMEDGLRPIRAIRFSSKLGFIIEEKTFLEISKPQILQKINSISIERFRDEFEKILLTKTPSIGLNLLEKTGILYNFIPEFLECKNCIQGDFRAFHKFDVINHLFYACDGAVEKLNIRLAALFHDIGKPQAKKVQNENNEEKYTFYNHEIIGEEITRKILTRLRFSNEMINNVCHLVKEHMFHYEPDWTSSAVRRFIVRVKKENIEDLFDLRIADMFGMNNLPVQIKYNESINLLLEFTERIKNELSKQNALTVKDLALNGNDLINLGIPKGKQIGFVLNELFNCVLEDPKMNNREDLEKVVKNLNL